MQPPIDEQYESVLTEAWDSVNATIKAIEVAFAAAGLAVPKRLHYIKRHDDKRAGILNASGHRPEQAD